MSKLVNVDWNKARVMLAGGSSYTETAAAIGCSYTRLAVEARSQGWTRRRAGRAHGSQLRKPGARAARVIALHRDGVSTNAIAERLGMHVRNVWHTVTRWAPRLGFSP